VPTKPEELSVGDIVLCKVNGFQYLRLIKAIQGKRFQRGAITRAETIGNAFTI
jgi:hypothetical protein